MSEVEDAKDPSTLRMGGMRLAQRPCRHAVPFQMFSGVARWNWSFCKQTEGAQSDEREDYIATVCTCKRTEGARPM